MKTESPNYLPVDAMQLLRLTASGFKIPHNTVIAAWFDCDGPLEAQALFDSADKVLQRHSALRSTYHEIDGTFAQQIHSQRRAETYLRNEIPGNVIPLDRDPLYRKFDLQTGPFLRLRITRASARSSSFRLEFVTDHFVVDGFSLQVILDDISYYYDCNVSGRMEDKPPAAQHVDYARRQRIALTSARIHEVYDAWDSQLRLDRPPKDRVPSDRTAESMWNTPEATRRLRTRLPGGWVERLHEWRRSKHVTAFMATAAIYSWSLAKAESSECVTFLTPILGRSQRDHRYLVGNLARTLPVRLIGNPGSANPLTECITEIRRGIAFAMKYQDLAVNVIASELSRRSGWYVDCPNSPFFSLKDELRLDLSDIDAHEVDIDFIAEAMLPHSTGLNLSSAGAFIDTIYDPERASLNTLKRLHANIRSTDFSE